MSYNMLQRVLLPSSGVYNIRLGIPVGRREERVGRLGERHGRLNAGFPGYSHPSLDALSTNDCRIQTLLG